MSEEAPLERLMQRAPADIHAAVLMFPSSEPSRWRVAWYGLSADQVVRALYHMADEVLDQLGPLNEAKH